MHYIYKITNNINQKIYIGQTNNPALRWSQHKSNAKYNKGQQVITRAMIKHGIENFDFKVISSCWNQQDLDYTEAQIISQYDSMNLLKGYNINAGGNTSPRTPIVLQKISEGLKKYYKEHDGWLKGGVLTNTWKENISKASIGKLGTNIGKKFSDEWKVKISKSQVGKERKLKRRFAEEIEKEICKLYVEEGKSTYALSKQFDCGRNLILSILKRNNITTKQSNYTGHFNNCNIFTLEQELEICKIYQMNNISRAELSKQYNCGKTTIRDILLRHNIKL